MVPSINAQMGLFGIAAAGLSLYGAADDGMSDRARIVTGGLAGIFGLASALGGYKVWSAINAGIMVGTFAGIPASRLGGDQSTDGVTELSS